MPNLERCCNCDDPTGRAGRGEDSLYLDAINAGPFCQRCWDAIVAELDRDLEREVERLKAQDEIQGRILFDVEGILKDDSLDHEESVDLALEKLKENPPTWDTFTLMEVERDQANAELTALRAPRTRAEVEGGAGDGCNCVATTGRAL
jgi:hypothetical protein